MLHRIEAMRVQILHPIGSPFPKMELNVEFELELPCKTHPRMAHYAIRNGYIFTALSADYNHKILCCSELPPVEGPDD